jgi:hypothetical protein
MTNTPKKRGRPAGSKTKVKRYEISRTQIQLAEKLGISPEKYMEALVRENMIKAKKVNWKELAKQLQAALESQIEDYTILETKVQMLEKEANEFADSYRRQITVISYLETKLGLNPI